MSEQSIPIESPPLDKKSGAANVKSVTAKGRNELQPASHFGIDLHPDAIALINDSTLLSEAYGGTGFKDLMASKIVIACAAAACIGGLLFGFDQGLVSIILVMPRFVEQFPEINGGFYKGLMTAMLELGAFVGAIQAGFLADKYSRKITLFIGLVWFVIGSTIQTAAFNYGTLVAGRAIGGVGVGVLSTTAPLYVSEIAPPNIRGFVLGIEQFMIVFGIVVMFFITYGTRVMDNDWCFRLPFFLQMVPGFFLGVIIFFLPYSPRWLAGRGRDQECLEVLCRVRQLPPTDPRVQAEWIQIRAEATHNAEAIIERHPTLVGDGFKMEFKREIASWLDMFKPAVIRRTFIGITIMFFQQFVGINALIYYSPTLFETLGLEYNLRLIMSGVMNVIQLLAVIFSIFLLDKVGRRFWLLAGSVGMTICHVVVAAMIGQYSHDWARYPGQAWVGVAFILLFMVPFGVGWGPIPWSMPSEIHASSYRAKGVALATCSNWLNNFIIGLISPPLVENTGYGAFVFYAAFSALSGVWTYFIVPETRGRSLEDMDRLFKSDTARHDEAQKLQITEILCSGYDKTRSGQQLRQPAPKRTGEENWVEKV